MAKQIRGSIIRRLDSFRESNPSSWCGYLDDAIGAAEVIAETLEKNATPTIPTGHRVVPVAPTEAMVSTAISEFHKSGKGLGPESMNTKARRVIRAVVDEGSKS